LIAPFRAWTVHDFMEDLQRCQKTACRAGERVFGKTNVGRSSRPLVIVK
jgi:hypothetical protein